MPTPTVIRLDQYTFAMTAEHLGDLRVILDRAMNTWDPNSQPTWLRAFSDRVDKLLGSDSGVPQV